MPPVLDETARLQGMLHDADGLFFPEKFRQIQTIKEKGGNAL
jgi:hypothetical protein